MRTLKHDLLTAFIGCVFSLGAIGLFAQESQADAPGDLKATAARATGASDSRTLRIAIVQMHSLDHDIDGNLKRAAAFAERAAAQGAALVLYPEFMPTGSYLSFDTWDSAEPSNGKTVQWLKLTSRRLHLWLGAGFFEADGSDFYDTFVITTPGGEEAGRVRCLWFHGPVPVEPVAVLTASLKADADLRNRAYQDQLEYVSAVSAEGHANADLTGSSFDGMRRDSVEFDRSQS